MEETTQTHKNVIPCRKIGAYTPYCFTEFATASLHSLFTHLSMGLYIQRLLTDSIHIMRYKVLKYSIGIIIPPRLRYRLPAYINSLKSKGKGGTPYWSIVPLQKDWCLHTLLLHRVRNLFPPQSFHPLFYGLISYQFSLKAISLMLIAAFMSLSRCSPHCGQTHFLSDNFKSWFT